MWCKQISQGKRFFVYIVLMVIGIVFLTVPETVAQPPNFIIFFPDQLRAREVNVYGNPTITDPVTTPNMDMLASSGIRFNYAFPGLPVCTPSRACIMTGRMPFAVRSSTEGKDWMVENKITMHTEEITFAEQLNELGYSCSHVGKWHLDESPNLSWIPPEGRQGFDWWEGFNSYGKLTDAMYFNNAGDLIEPEPSPWLPDLINERAINFINMHPNDSFCLMVSLGPPHAPGGQSWREEHELDTVFTADRMYLWSLFEFATVTLPPNVPIVPDPYPDPERQLREYHAMTKGIDELLGDILTRLAELNIDDNTIIIVCSDHGSQMGSHGEWEKNVIYEESIHVPLIIYDPRQLVSPTVYDHLTHLIDILPTIVELAGGTPTPRAQGMSLAPLITGQGTYTPRDAAMVQFRTTSLEGVGYGWSRALRTDQWKYALMEVGGVGTGDIQPKALFDLDADPYELNNLIDNPAYDGIRDQLHNRIIQEMIAVEDPMLDYIFPGIGLSISSINHLVHMGTDLPNDTFTVANTGSGTLNYTISDNGSWLSESPDNGSSTGEEDTINIIYGTSGLTVGDYSAVIEVEDANAHNSPQTIAVDIHVYIPGDFDEDGDVDMEDFGYFQACFSGSGNPYSYGCADASLDFDLDVDSTDFNIFAGCLGGANQPPGC